MSISFLVLGICRFGTLILLFFLLRQTDLFSIVFVVDLNDLLHQSVAHHVALAEVVDGDVVDVGQNANRLYRIAPLKRFLTKMTDEGDIIPKPEPPVVTTSPEPRRSRAKPETGWA